MSVIPLLFDILVPKARQLDPMRLIATVVLLFLFTPILIAQVDVIGNYVNAWKQFYPSKTLQLGIHEAIFDYEDLSEDKVKEWINFNKDNLPRIIDLEESSDANTRINAIHIHLQIREELEKWEIEAHHHTSLTLYTDLIRNALKSVNESEFLTTGEKQRLREERLSAMTQLAMTARSSLKQISTQELERGVEMLNVSQGAVQALVEGMQASEADGNQWKALCNQTLAELRRLNEHIELVLSPKADVSDGRLGMDKYARKLAIYTNDGLTPKKLEEMALKEIEDVKGLMEKVAKKFLQTKYEELELPADQKEVINLALADMEKDVTSNAEEYTAFWNQLSDSIADFLRVEQIASVPVNQTLSIKPAPESAGPAARIGWVSSAPPFDPNPWTTLYLPSVPDTLSAKEQAEFWASFNKPFNRMIAIHELFPGHYMQIKMARESPHRLRLLFPYGPYIEGWATFCEKIVLDAGWDADKPLSRLAHLRKRLENANRAYTSVMVHCHNWDQTKVMEFSTQVSLLAPQFAKSLWGRLLRGPMQMTSYFYGGQEFRDLYQSEQKIQGETFVLKEFMDTVLKAGPIPTKEFSRLFQEASQN